MIRSSSLCVFDVKGCSASVSILWTIRDTIWLNADKFVEDEGWHQAAERYENFLRTRKGKILFLELGVGYNTPVIIKYPFWQMTAKNQDATYACVNYGEAVCPEDTRKQSICIDGDIGQVIEKLEAVALLKY